MNQVLVICGRTATGKTALAVDLAQRYSGEIISTDSRQAYQYMDIGTGKDVLKDSAFILDETVTFKEEVYQRGYYLVNDVKLWLYDVALPTQPIHIGLFYELTWRSIHDCWRRGMLPIVVGGDGFYLKSIFNPPETLAVPQNVQLRQELEQLDAAELQRRLQAVDQSRWLIMNHSDRHNPRRLIRAIEVAVHGPIEVGSYSFMSDIIWAGLDYSPELLETKIGNRVERRLANGFEAEVKELVRRFPNFYNLPASNTLGYAQWKDVLDGKISPHQAVDLWIQAEISYAKRQKTWFKKQTEIEWFMVDDPKWKEGVVAYLQTQNTRLENL